MGWLVDHNGNDDALGSVIEEPTEGGPDGCLDDSLQGRTNGTSARMIEASTGD